MRLKCCAYIFLASGFDPAIHRHEIKNASSRYIVVGLDFSRKAEVVEIARGLVADEGVELLELCGGFGPTWIDQISKALGPSVPVGGVFYGPEFRRRLVELTA